MLPVAATTAGNANAASKGSATPYAQHCHLAATVLLHNPGPTACRKVEAAEQVVAALLDGSPHEEGAPGGEAAALPPLVRVHYLRSLVEWSCGALTKRDAAGAAAGGEGKKGKKRKQQEADDTLASGAAAAAREGQERPKLLQPRCWAVLTAVLGSSATPPTQQLPAALLPAATAVLQLARERSSRVQQSECEALLVQLAALLRLLHSKFGASFRPSVEHSVALVEAALLGHATAAVGGSEQGAWEGAAAAAARVLQAAASGHPTQRKVWDAAVPRLLPLLAAASFPVGAGSSTSEECSGNQLARCCRQVLDAVIFHPQHVAPLAAAAAAEMAAALAAAASTGDTAAEGSEAAPAEATGAGGSNNAGYAAQLFAAVRRDVAAGRVPLALLPWMVGRFCAALRQHRRAAETGDHPHWHDCCCRCYCCCRQCSGPFLLLLLYLPCCFCC